MTIRPGEAWERPIDGVRELPVVRSDRELAAVAVAGLSDGRPAGPVLLRGGDLHRTLGSPAPRADRVAADVDVLEVLDADRGAVLGHAVAHVVITAGRWPSYLLGEVIVAGNSGHLGSFEVAPRAHPGDGLVDVLSISARMSIRQRMTAMARARTGGHLPHPDITVRRVPAYEIEFGRPARVRLDGERVGRVRAVTIRVLPDAVTIVF